MKKLGIALSGGGHRATIFALGVLLYLVDAGRNKNVHTITSVSGGSITNAFISLLDKPFNDLEKNDFELPAAEFANQIAGSPVWFYATLIFYVFCLSVFFIPVLKIGQFEIFFWHRFAIFSITICFLALFIGPKSRGSIWAWWGTWLYLSLLLIGFVLAIKVWQLHQPLWSIIIGFTLILAISQRNNIAATAYGKMIRFKNKTANVSLTSSPATSVRHIFCATETHVGRHIFFSRDFVYLKDFGIGQPDRINMSTAIQASANFPGAFPFYLLKSKTLNFAKSIKDKLPTYLILTDGGVYDNMATSWYNENDEILFFLKHQMSFQEIANGKYTKELDKKRLSYSVQETAQILVDELKQKHNEVIVVNASYPKIWKKWTVSSLPLISDIINFLKITLISDLLSFVKITSIFYDNVNFNKCKDLKLQILNQKFNGALATIDETPLTLAGHLVEEMSQKKPYFDEVLLPTKQEKKNHWLNLYRWKRQRLTDIRLFYADQTYPSGKNVSKERIGRARQAIEYLYPSYLDSIKITDIEKDKFLKLQNEIDQYQKEIDFKEQNIKDIKDELERTKEERDLAEIKFEKLNKSRRAQQNLQNNIRSRLQSSLSKFLPNMMNWDKIRRENWKVPTTLRPLGIEQTAQLLYQGYFCAMMNLHILMDGYPLINPIPKIEDFEDIARGKRRKHYCD